MRDFNETDIFDKKVLRRELTKEILKDVVKIIQSKNYDPINQLMGYIQTENPVYIPRDNGARDKIINISKDEILDCLICEFIKEDKC